MAGSTSPVLVGSQFQSTLAGSSGGRRPRVVHMKETITVTRVDPAERSIAFSVLRQMKGAVNDIMIQILPPPPGATNALSGLRLVHVGEEQARTLVGVLTNKSFSLAHLALAPANINMRTVNNSVNLPSLG